MPYNFVTKFGNSGYTEWFDLPSKFTAILLHSPYDFIRNENKVFGF
jgi:hypothetical protein